MPLAQGPFAQASLARLERAVYMGRAIDTLEGALTYTLTTVTDDGQLLLNEAYMMGIFADLERELPPLAAYVKDMYDTKRMELACSSVSERHFARLRRELFSPEQEANKKTPSTPPS
eukprot:3423867-Pleurochrysis_carterae.AAC.2